MDGRSILVAVMAKEILGLDPDNGEILWSHPHTNQVQLNASTPVAGADGILFVSSAYDGGCRALQVSATGVKELWSHRLLRIHHANAVRIGDVVYSSSGDIGPAPLTAIDVKTGKMLWRDRDLGKASMLPCAARCCCSMKTVCSRLRPLMIEGRKLWPERSCSSRFPGRSQPSLMDAYMQEIDMK